MTIQSSAFAVGPAQRDGRVLVTETHTDSVVGALLFTYLGASANAATVMNARVASINSFLAQAEFESAILVPARPVLQQQNATQFSARLRARYRDATQIECARLATWIMDRVDAGDITAAQMQNAFGLTAGQWTNLASRMISLRTAYNAAVAAQGE